MTIEFNPTVLQGCSEEIHPTIYGVLKEFSTIFPKARLLNSCQRQIATDSDMVEIKVTIEGLSYRLWVDGLTDAAEIRKALEDRKDINLVM